MYHPKRIILTPRGGDENQTALFSEASTREQEITAYDLAPSARRDNFSLATCLASLTW